MPSGPTRTSWWTNLIVMFELTMLGAILAIVLTLLVTAGLRGPRSRLYDRGRRRRTDPRGHREPVLEPRSGDRTGLKADGAVRLKSI